jgi:hypothetical protein
MGGFLAMPTKVPLDFALRRCTAVQLQMTGGNNTILSSALTCGNGSWTSGLLNGTPILVPNDTVDINVIAADASTTNIRVVVAGTI